MPSSSSKAQLRIRVGSPENIDAIVGLIESAYRGESGLQGWTTETHLIDGQRTDVEEIGERIREPNSRFLCAWQDETLVGCCLIEHQAPAAYFGMFAVSPLRQGAGIGGQLLTAAESFAEEKLQATKMTMSVIWIRTELLAWYARRGYKNTGARLPFPYGEPRAGLPLRDDLYFMVLEKPLVDE